MPLRVIGVNSIVAYCMDHLIEDFLVGSVYTHFGRGFFQSFGPYESLVVGGCVLVIYWSILYWMDRHRIDARI